MPSRLNFSFKIEDLLPKYLLTYLGLLNSLDSKVHRQILPKLTYEQIQIQKYICLLNIYKLSYLHL